MNTTYLSPEQINTLVRLCEETLSNSNKSRIKELQEKYNFTFTASRQENLNKVWQYVQDIMSKDKVSRTRTGETFAEATRKSIAYGGAGYITEYIQAYIERHIKKDYDFIKDFKPDELTNAIAEILRIAGLPNDTNFSELLEVSNYDKYFKQKYGLENCSKEALKATDNFIKWADSVTIGLKNKEAFLWALADYLKKQDKTTVHTILHK